MSRNMNEIKEELEIVEGRLYALHNHLDAAKEDYKEDPTDDSVRVLENIKNEIDGTKSLRDELESELRSAEYSF